MDKNNAKDFLPLVQALADGKTIQYRPSPMDSFADVNELRLSSGPERYRIKPDPPKEYHEYFIVERLDKPRNEWIPLPGLYFSRDAAANSLKWESRQRGETIDHFRVRRFVHSSQLV